MNNRNKETASIWADALGDVYVGCYGLMDDLKSDIVDESTINEVYEASELIEKAQNILSKIAESI